MFNIIFDTFQHVWIQISKFLQPSEDSFRNITNIKAISQLFT